MISMKRSSIRVLKPQNTMPSMNMLCNPYCRISSTKHHILKKNTQICILWNNSFSVSFLAPQVTGKKHIFWYLTGINSTCSRKIIKKIRQMSQNDNRYRTNQNTRSFTCPVERPRHAKNQVFLLIIGKINWCSSLTISMPAMGICTFRVKFACKTQLKEIKN